MTSLACVTRENRDAVIRLLAKQLALIAAFLKNRVGNLSSVHFVSCMQRTSGLTASSQRVTLGIRARTELTFQVAISIRPQITRIT